MNSQDRINEWMKERKERGQTDGSDLMDLFWDNYRQTRVAFTASPTQVKLTKQAFFAGAFAALQATSVGPEALIRTELATQMRDACIALLDGLREGIREVH